MKFGSNKKKLGLESTMNGLKTLRKNPIQNIAGRLPENSRNSFVDLRSQKKNSKDRPKKFVFSLIADMLNFD